ncbi:MAG: response regulator [Planctomycetota bacterium]|nr:response regulator [Planctomycetota bacterium]
MTVGLLRQAVGIYEREAFHGSDHEAISISGGDDEPIAVALSSLLDESRLTGGAVVHCYTMRIGNPRYPFMKLVLQEHLVQDEYFFEVDTHDQMFKGAESEGTEFQSLKRYNLELKGRVEWAWGEAMLPTSGHLKGLVETRPTRRNKPNGQSILVVDDDDCIAKTLSMLLEARGYAVTCLMDGKDAIEVADANSHDLILMDNEMKHLNGFEACRVLKSRAETRDIPVLIATAGSLTLQQLDAADGFLVKPFRMELLFSMIEHMLPLKPPPTPTNEEPGAS